MSTVISIASVILSVICAFIGIAFTIDVYRADKTVLIHKEKLRMMLWVFLIVSFLIGVITKQPELALMEMVYTLAVFEDEVEYEVYDIFHISIGVLLIGQIFVKLMNGDYKYLLLGDLWVFDLIYFFIPLIFVISSIKTRGMADSLYMVNIWLYGVFLGIDTVLVLGVYLLGYVLGIIRKICVFYPQYKSIIGALKETQHLPFLWTLYISSMVIYGLVGIFVYQVI